MVLSQSEYLRRVYIISDTYLIIKVVIEAQHMVLI
jgi:hypothetical protein